MVYERAMQCEMYEANGGLSGDVWQLKNGLGLLF